MSRGEKPLAHLGGRGANGAGGAPGGRMHHGMKERLLATPAPAPAPQGRGEVVLEFEKSPRMLHIGYFHGTAATEVGRRVHDGRLGVLVECLRDLC